MELAFDDGLLRIARTDIPPGLRVAGEVDHNNTPAFGEVLAAATHTGGDVHVDLAGLEFINVEGLRLLMSAAAQVSPSGALVLEALPPHLFRVIHLAGWDATPGLEFGGAR